MKAFQLYRWGQPYFCYGDHPAQVKFNAMAAADQPWWWLWLLGWRVKRTQA